MKAQILLSLLALFSLPQFARAQGNLVFNGGFDITTGNDAAGWTRTGAAFANGKNGNPAPDFVLGLGQMVSQSINNLAPGTVYSISGDYYCVGSDYSTISFQVSMDGTPLFETAVPTNPSWNHFDFQYAATSSSAVLSLSQTYWAYLSVDFYSIDNISMYAVPEPSVFCLFAAGVLSYCCFKKRANKKRNVVNLE